jgi:Family of unknown function (DUF5681)
MNTPPTDYKVGPGRPPLHTRFKKGQSGNPRGGRVKQLSVLLAEALEQKTVVTIGGRRRRITKREAMVAQLVEKSAAADLRAVKLLLDMQKSAEAEAGVAPPAVESDLDEADEKVINTIMLRLKLADEQFAAQQAASLPDAAAPPTRGSTGPAR